MNEFWESFGDGADAAIETMGETVYVGGRALQAVVHEVAMNPVVVPGGLSEGVTHTLHVSVADGEGIGDGDAVECRGWKGKVVSKAAFGGGWILQAGPANRWDGELE